MTTKLQPHQIKAAHQALSTVKSIDEDIERMGRETSDDIVHHGKGLRSNLVRLRVRYLTDEQLGEVVLYAVINALLAMRAEVIASSGALVEFPDAPRIPTRKAAQ